MHKKSKFAPYLLPWLCTIGLLLELPLKPVLSDNQIFAMSGTLLLQIYMLLNAQACQTLVMAICMAGSGGYLVYYWIKN